MTARLAFVGFHREGYRCLEALLTDGHRFEAVFTFTPEKMRSLSGGVDYGPLAGRYGVPLYPCESLLEHAATIGSLAVDIVFVIGWTEIVRPQLLCLARQGFIGMHASLVPDYRGGSPVNWAIIQGETRTGQTMFWLDAQLDKGDIIDQEPVGITLHDTCGTVYEKMGHAGVVMLRRNMPALLAGTAPRRPQPDTKRPLWKRRKPSDGRVDWNQPSKRVYDFIRAVTHPYPGAFVEVPDGKLFLWEADWLPEWDTSGTSSGRIVGRAIGFGASKGGVVVACAEGAVLVRRVQVEGQEESDAIDLGFLREGTQL
jgi:methionyl-tRNA formyltransferase